VQKQLLRQQLLHIAPVARVSSLPENVLKPVEQLERVFLDGLVGVGLLKDRQKVLACAVPQRPVMGEEETADLQVSGVLCPNALLHIPSLTKSINDLEGQFGEDGVGQSLVQCPGIGAIVTRGAP